MDNAGYTYSGRDGDGDFSPQIHHDPYKSNGHSDIHIEMKNSVDVENGSYGNGTNAAKEGYENRANSDISLKSLNGNGNGVTHAQKDRKSHESHDHGEPCRFAKWLMNYPRTVFCELKHIFSFNIFFYLKDLYIFIKI